MELRIVINLISLHAGFICLRILFAWEIVSGHLTLILWGVLFAGIVGIGDRDHQLPNSVYPSVAFLVFGWPIIDVLNLSLEKYDARK